ncbi:hypothetical protein PVAP13_1KG119300 [Panicum virgatum]|uniref:Secreted protein n=1 Tax=Panicum virgatum TaxID=38727 RepID=A0A8T0XIB4_PANVG|nr:hypothetical protein PVAP13_1KG119300 [Panicum virgatum]
MRDVRFHLDLQVILVLCLLVPVLFLQDSVTGYGGDEPLMCNHVNCEESEMAVPTTVKRESYRSIPRKLTRPLPIPTMSIAVQRKLADKPNWDGTHPIPDFQSVRQHITKQYRDQASD